MGGHSFGTGKLSQETFEEDGVLDRYRDLFKNTRVGELVFLEFLAGEGSIGEELHEGIGKTVSLEEERTLSTLEWVINNTNRVRQASLITKLCFDELIIDEIEEGRLVPADDVVVDLDLAKVSEHLQLML